MARTFTTSRLFILGGMIFILLLATALRFHWLDAQSFWNDEGLSWINSLRTIPEITHIVTFHDVHPPGYYYVLGAWRILTGESEFALRSLSTFFSILSVAFAFALGKRLYGSIAGLASAAFVAVNTFSIFYAQEARMYAMLAFVAIASMWVFVGLMQTFWAQSGNSESINWKSRNILWLSVALALVNIVGLYTQYTFPLVMLTQGILFVAWFLVGIFRHGFRSLVPALVIYTILNILTLIPFIPWIQPALSQLLNQPDLSDPVSLDTMLRSIIGWLTYGVTYEYTFASGIIIGVYVLLIFGLFPLRNATKYHPHWRTLLPVIWILVTVGTFMLAGLYLRYLRFLIPVQIAVAIWMGRGVWVLWHAGANLKNPRWQRLPQIASIVLLAIVVLNMLQGLQALYNAPEFQRDDYRSIVQTINRSASENDAIILDSPSQDVIFDYYYHGDLPIYPLPASVNEPDEARNDTLDVIDNHERIFVIFWGDRERDVEGVVEATLAENAYQISDEWYGDARFVQYVSPTELVLEYDTTIQFGDSITLDSYSLSENDLEAGDVLQLEFHWVTAAPLTERYKVFIQLLDSEGTLVTQRDSEPVSGKLPTVDWENDQIIQDNHALFIPENLAAGEYTLIAGLYSSQEPYARLPLSDASDFLILDQIIIR